jgi:hypothetical protein
VALVRSVINVLCHWHYCILTDWWRPHREETLLMMTALFALFLLETLPIVIFLSSATLLMRQLDWMTGLAIICVGWAVLLFLAHFVRCAVYQTIGEHS